MHANHREEREEIGAGEIAAGVGLKQTTTGDTLSAESAPIVLESMTFPEPVISVAVEPKSKADQDKLGSGLARLAEEDPTFRVTHRRGDRPDADRRHGRAPPRDHRRPAQARVQRRRERRPAAGRLPRDDLAAGREDPGPVRPPDRRLGPVRRRRHQPATRRSRAPATSSTTRSSAARSRRSTSRPSTQGIQEAMGSGVLAGYPVVDVKVELIDGSLPRRRLERARLQDRGLDGLQGGDEAGEAEAARARDVRRGDDARGLPRRRDRQPQLAARPHRVDDPRRQRPGRSRRSSRCPRCSATRPTCARCRRAGQTSTWISSGTRTCRSRSPSEIVEQGGGGS